MNVDPNDVIRLADIPHASPREQATYTQALREGTLREVKVLKFVKDLHQSDGLPGYVAGDVAGFDLAQASALIAAGIATEDLNAGPRPQPRRIEVANGAPTAAAAGDVALRLLKPWGNLMPGDTAGFNPALAHELVVKGVATPTDTSKPRCTLRMIRDAIMRR